MYVYLFGTIKNCLVGWPDGFSVGWLASRPAAADFLIDQCTCV